MKLKKISEKNEVSLGDLIVGQSAKIIKINCKNKRLEQRLLDFGLVENEIIVVKKIAPFFGPICFKIKGYQLCLRKADAKDILVRVEK